MVMVRNSQAYKYETPYKVTYNIIHSLTNGTITLLMLTETYRVNICRNKPYHLEEFL